MAISTSFVAVIDRQFKGEIASAMDKLTSKLSSHFTSLQVADCGLARALQAQVEAAVRILLIVMEKDASHCSCVSER